jgi:hypothetical protein
MTPMKNTATTDASISAVLKFREKDTVAWSSLEGGICTAHSSRFAYFTTGGVSKL